MLFRPVILVQFVFELCSLVVTPVAVAVRLESPYSHNGYGWGDDKCNVTINLHCHKYIYDVLFGPVQLGGGRGVSEVISIL